MSHRTSFEVMILQGVPAEHRFVNLCYYNHYLEEFYRHGIFKVKRDFIEDEKERYVWIWEEKLR